MKFVDRIFKYNFKNKSLIDEVDSLDIVLTSKTSSDIRFYNRNGEFIERMYTSSSLIPERITKNLITTKKDKFVELINPMIENYNISEEDKKVIFSNIDVYKLINFEFNDVSSVKFSFEYSFLVVMELFNKDGKEIHSINIPKSELSKNLIKIISKKLN